VIMSCLTYCSNEDNIMVCFFRSLKYGDRRTTDQYLKCGCIVENIQKMKTLSSLIDEREIRPWAISINVW
jgi:hypothetical protein